MNTTPEPELTHEARQAIRSYMMKLVTLPAVFASVALFFAGYFAKDVFGAKAENAAYATASAKILDMTAAASQAQAEAANAKLQASEAISQAQKTNQKLNEAAKQVDDLLVTQRANIAKTTTDVTQELLKDRKFFDSFVRIGQSYVFQSAFDDFVLDIRDGDQGVKNRQAVQVSRANGERAQIWRLMLANQ
jgi:hypothetical protein